jgi:peptidoglycan/LPS O-acetylase OafA/YrhL
MNSSPSPEISKTSSSQRYEGLDAIRGLAAFGVVWLHTFQSGATNVVNPGDFIGSESIAWLKLRDFSLPLIVMSSFFVLTISILRKPENNFSSFFTTRFKRLWIPLFIWTNVYCLMWTFVIPLVLGWNNFGQILSIDVFISGYMHLWFLQFILLGSLIVYPVLSWLRSKSEAKRMKISILFFLSAAIYVVVLKLLIQPIIQPILISFNPSVSLKIFIQQASKYVFFIPIAVGLGILSNQINNLYKRNVFRICSLIAVLFSLIFHMTVGYSAISAPIYGISAFMAALQPWKKIPLRLVYVSAEYSYGIYILHFFLCEAFHLLISRGKFELNSAAIFSISVLFYVMSFGVAVLLRKIIPMDWFIPLVPVGLKRSVRNANP